jgi:MFS transporter, DHA3 family, macrolide efflux protein
MEAVAEARDKVMNRDFILLWQGQFISQMGNQVYAVAMVFWISQTTGSASLLGLLMMLSHLPAVIFGPIGGALADRISRRSIIIVSDLLCGVVVVGIGSLLLLAPDATHLIIPALFFVSIFVSLVGVFFRPTVFAATPDIVPRDKISVANSLNQVTMQITGFIGQGVGGVLFRLLGAPVLFLANGVSYLFAAFMESFIRIPQVMPEKSRNRKEFFQNFKSDTAEGFRYVWNDSGMKALFLAAGGLNFFLVPVGLLLPFYVDNTLKARADWYGFLVAGFGIGALIGTLLAGAVRASGSGRSKLVIASMFILSVSVGLLGVVNVPTISLLLLCVAGVMCGFVNTAVVSILQMTTPTEIRGRVFGLLNTLETGLIPIAMGLGGVVADLTGKRVPLIYLGCGIISAALSLLVSLNRDLRGFLAKDSKLD